MAILLDLYQSQQIDHGGKYFSIYRGIVLWLAFAQNSVPLVAFLSQETGRNGWTSDSSRLVRSLYTLGSCLRCENPGPLSGRGLEARKRFTVVCWNGSSDSSGTLFYANRVSFFLVSRSRSRRRRGVNCYATRCLHYHISDAICSRELMRTLIFPASSDPPLNCLLERFRMTFPMSKDRDGVVARAGFNRIWNFKRFFVWLNQRVVFWLQGFLLFSRWKVEVRRSWMIDAFDIGERRY